MDQKLLVPLPQFAAKGRRFDELGRAPTIVAIFIEYTARNRD